jgi:hypothetical protein
MIVFAMDRASVRRTDVQGFLHVETSPISKAQIRNYAGREIPGWQELGLDANRTYRMFCPPEELERAAGTFNGVPLLRHHIPVNSASIPDDLIVGSLGSVAAFDGTYLNNALSVWKEPDIRAIHARRKYQLSSAYRYMPVMDAGEYQGLPYDGKMTDIAANHVAIVFEGRAGPDVVIGDETMLKSKAAYMASGALMGYIAPKLMSGQKVDIALAMDGVNAEALSDDAKVKALADKIVTLTDGKLAQDQSLDADGIVTVIGCLAFDAGDDEITDAPALAEDEEMVDGKVCKKKKPAPKDDKPAMDAAKVNTMIADAVTAAEARVTAAAAALRTAEREVSPVVGEIACDSAPAAYKLALDHYKVDLTGVAEDSYGALFRATHAQRSTKVIAQDAKPTVSVLASIVPNLKPMGVM